VAWEKVTFRFRSTVPDSSFRCEVRKEKPPGPKSLRFNACDSPKSYTLAPGRYEFKVRAVAAGLRDLTPAHGSFRIVRERD
jgi:hypothetical protein